MTTESHNGDNYILEEQIGFLLRLAQQRHTALFAECFDNDMTPTQWAVIAKLKQIGECSQNLLGRHTAMDVATIQGVVERLKRRDILVSQPDPEDRRRVVLRLSENGKALYESKRKNALEATLATLAPLNVVERKQLGALLRKLT